jgi:thymidylate kinase
MLGGIDLDSYFFDLDAVGAPFCVVGRTDNIPHEIESDLDIVMDVEPKAALEYIKLFCLSQGLQIVQHFRHEISAHYYVLWKKNGERDDFIRIDICRDYLRDARFFLSAKRLVSSRRKVNYGRKAHQAFYVPKSEFAFIYYLIKRLDKMQLNEEHGEYLSRLWHEAPKESHEQLAQYFRDDSILIIERAAESGNWNEVHYENSSLRRDLRQHARRLSLRMWAAEAMRVLERVVQPTGMHVVFLGADGSGKSSVIGTILDALEPVFRRRTRHHLFPAGTSAPTEGPVIDPHSQASRGTVLSTIQLILWLLRYTVGWVRDIWPARVRSTGVFFDRYYHDLLVDPRRYRYGGPIWLARAVGFMIPKPDLWILLDAPVDVLQARKREVPAQESERQRNAYLSLIGTYENAVVIDASRPIEVVSMEARRAVLEFLTKRTAGRLGLNVID